MVLGRSILGREVILGAGPKVGSPRAFLSIESGTLGS